MRVARATAKRKAAEDAWLAAIIAARAAGEPIAEIAESGGVTKQRVSQIAIGLRKKNSSQHQGHSDVGGT